jgi:hypothetical protein
MLQKSRRWATTKQVAEHTRQSDSKYEKMRVTGEGPPFYKAGKTVLYDLNEVDDWIAAQRHESTSDVSTNLPDVSPPVGRRRSEHQALTRGAGSSP